MKNISVRPNKLFWANKRVVVTGSLGFKGQWLSSWLHMLNACVLGIDKKSEFQRYSSDGKTYFEQYHSDLLSSEWHNKVLEFKPDIVFHFAADALVKEGYDNPELVIDNNLRSTMNLYSFLEKSNKNCLLITATTDKVYAEQQPGQYHVESDVLGGQDPYSMSKVFVEKYLQLKNHLSPIKTTIIRSGNVIGGGDFSNTRLLPDIFRAWSTGKPITIRNPKGIRPWMHVIDSLNGYLLAAESSYDSARKCIEIFNLAPKFEDQVTVSEVVEASSSFFKIPFAQFAEIVQSSEFYERESLFLDAKKAQSELFWSNKYSWQESIYLTLDWYRTWFENKENAENLKLEQIKKFMAPSGEKEC